ncbi:chemotaxis protein CheX [Granulicella sp. dw_53]|uniref:chemotaxis protein CheX n=1 Tax=Granulicella sp. dw_53 TaxID=2719792 RepID=UPI001BD3CE21|nr:chemotaxis protein CheX [Granulicella sp. dw_53]
MSESMVALKSLSAEDFLSAKNMERVDDTVAEVFSMMLGFDVESIPAAVPTANPGEMNERTAIVGFSGSMRGSCEVRVDFLAAKDICVAMIGDASAEEEDSISDALGELCNMLAGGWKNRLPSFSAECSLSPPTVISGRDYRVHMSTPSVRLVRTYRFGEHTFHLTLHQEDPITA